MISPLRYHEPSIIPLALRLHHVENKCTKSHGTFQHFPSLLFFSTQCDLIIKPFIVKCSFAWRVWVLMGDSGDEILILKHCADELWAKRIKLMVQWAFKSMHIRLIKLQNLVFLGLIKKWRKIARMQNYNFQFKVKTYNHPQTPPG